MTARSRRCRASWPLPVTRRPGRRARALRAATCCPAPPPRSAARARCSSIWKVEEVIDHPQIAARGAIQEIDTPYGRLRFAGSGFQLAHGGGRLDSMAPELSAHTDEVLTSLGYGREAIAGLRAREV